VAESSFHGKPQSVKEVFILKISDAQSGIRKIFSLLLSTAVSQRLYYAENPLSWNTVVP